MFHECFLFNIPIHCLTHSTLIEQFLSVSAEPHDGIDIEPDAKRARTGAYSGSAERKSPAVTEVEAELSSQEGKESRAEEVEQTPWSEVQGNGDGSNTGGGDASRNGVGVSSAEGGAALRSGPAAEFKQQDFHLVKLARNGMVYISIPSRSPEDLVTFFAKIIKDFHTRSRAAPRYFHHVS